MEVLEDLIVYVNNKKYLFQIKLLLSLIDNSSGIFFKSSNISYLTNLFFLLIFFCSCKIPYTNASAVGGQPGT